MSEEEKNPKEDCICKTKFFKKFLTIALASFVGVYCALCLFCLIHRPPINQMMLQQPLPPVIIQQDGHCKCHKMMKKFMNSNANEFKKEFEKMQNDLDD